MGSAAAGLGVAGRTAWAQPPAGVAPAELSGQTFDLAIGETTVNLTGRARTATTPCAGIRRAG